jgi:hypothetical protein
MAVFLQLPGVSRYEKLPCARAKSMSKKTQDRDDAAPPGDGDARRKAARVRRNGRMRRRTPRQVSRVRHIPVFRLLLYYAALVTIAVTLAHFVPITREAFVAPVSVPAVEQAGGLLNGNDLPPTSPAFGRPFGRAVITIVVILGALGLSLPIAFVSMWISSGSITTPTSSRRF